MRFETHAYPGAASRHPPADSSVAHLLEQALTAVETDLATTRACVARVAALLEREEAVGAPREGVCPDVQAAANAPLPADPANHARRRVGAGLAPWQARRVAAHVDDNLGFPITIDQLAGIAGLSSSYFCRAFKDSFGDPPHAWIMRRRVERAQALMLQTREPLSQIALACGLSDQAHLCNLFRRLVGQSPSHWRRARWQEA